ncbi:myo-inositol 2-dehydrogenase [Longimycelium tulufanense]|uniref:Myo-inositol 2-dehydrogenase n=1 Tax=Longimycelium tulufanense TaxID=907463 RepID=A0A8J3C9G1_9PSEU|nr:Gfo/Idh/MocA family oxidoreductase [Longimycelium tulufanense]GGM45430.1 myo-inositol 2-dehydrogenase [Longimycelium tulufanense]
MRIGLAGVGRIGAFHAQTLRTLPAIGTLVLADTDAVRAHLVAAQLGETGVVVLDRPDDLFSAGLDGLVIAAATDAHPELLERGVDAGIPVFCEKPVAPDVQGTLAVIDRVGGTEVPVQVGFQRRFDAGYTAARDAVAAGKLGWVHTVRACTLDPGPPTPEYVAASGGFFRDCSVHDFDIIRWVTGREVVEVFARGTNRGADFFRASGDVDTLAAMLVLDDDTLALVSATRYNAAGYDVRLEVLGSQDSVAVGLDDRLPLRSVEPGVRWPGGPAYPLFMDRFRPAFAAELSAFVDLVAGRGQSPCTVFDALEAFYIAEACERSRQENRSVRLDEVRR